jgi:hypothetical protein
VHSVLLTYDTVDVRQNSGGKESEAEMTLVWSLAALWLRPDSVATLASIWLKIATVLSEIVVGTIAN